MSMHAIGIPWSKKISTHCVKRYIFGLTHVPRLEDWPVMPVEHIGFTLMVSD